MPSSSIFDFFRYTGVDHRGRSMRSIQRFSLEELEGEHDYIQWLFPLPEGSGVLAQAPRLTNTDLDAFRGDPSLRAELRRSLDVMLAFYGSTMQGDPPVVSPTDTFTDRAEVWLTAGNHNHLRLSRIVRSCALLGLEKEARALQQYLLAIAAANPARVTPETVEFWKAATN